MKSDISNPLSPERFEYVPEHRTKSGPNKYLTNEGVAESWHVTNAENDKGEKKLVPQLLRNHIFKVVFFLNLPVHFSGVRMLTPW